MSRESIALALEWIEIFLDQDLDRALRITHPDVTLALPRHELEGGCDRGHDGLRRAWQRTAETWASLRVDIEEIRDAGDSVVLAGVGANRTHDGHDIEYRTAGFMRAADGKVIDSRTFSEDLDAPFALAGIQPHDDDDFARLRCAYAAFNAGDIEGVLGLLDESIQWNPAADFIDRERLHGLAAVRRHLLGLRDLWADMKLEPETLIQVEDTMVVRFRQTARGGRSGVDVAAEGWHVWEKGGDLVVRQHTFRAQDDAFALVCLTLPA